MTRNKHANAKHKLDRIKAIICTPWITAPDGLIPDAQWLLSAILSIAESNLDQMDEQQATAYAAVARLAYMRAYRTGGTIGEQMSEMNGKMTGWDALLELNSYFPTTEEGFAQVKEYLADHEEPDT